MTPDDASPPFPPLERPTPWPPPPEPPAGPREAWLRRTPLVGGLLAYPLWYARWSRHRRQVLNLLAERVAVQLETRPEARPVPGERRPAQIAKLISEAVSLEKGVWGVRSHDLAPAGPRDARFGPTLHPDDPMPPLMWGPFDDWTPYHLRTKLGETFGVAFPRDDDCVVRAWDERWTVGRFVAEIDRRCEDRPVSPHDARG